MASFRLPVLVALFLALVAVRAEAHPHVFVDAKSELVFDQAGRIAAIRHIWQFDQAFTQYAIQGLDVDNDSKLSDAELKPLADVNVKSLKEFEFFTYLTIGRDQAKFLPPTEYWLEFSGGRLTLFFTLQLEKPMLTGRHALLEIFDPEYFVGFSFLKTDPIRLVEAPVGCTSLYRPPHDLDAATMAVLAAIPVDQHDLPPDLRQAASVLANHVTISCPIPAGAKAPEVAAAAPPPAASGIADASPGIADASPGTPDASPAPEQLVASANPGGDDKPGGPAPAPMPAVPSGAVAEAATPVASPPARAGDTPATAVAGEANDASAGSTFPVFGLLLLLVAVAGGGLVLVMRRRPTRSR